MMILSHTTDASINQQYSADCRICRLGGLMKKQPERTAVTRSVFVDTFLALSEQKGIDKITVSELSAKAGYNRSTFYQYFNDTYDVLSYIEDDLLLYIKNTVVSQIGKAHPEQLFIDGFIRINAEKRRILKLLLGGSSTTFPVKLKEALIPLFAAQMHLSTEDEQTVYKLDFYLSGIISILSRWITSESPMAPEEYALLMRQIVEGMGRSALFPTI